MNCIVCVYRIRVIKCNHVSQISQTLGIPGECKLNEKKGRELAILEDKISHVGSMRAKSSRAGGIVVSDVDVQCLTGRG